MTNGKKENNSRAWVISVNMGYGHQRTAYPLRDLAFPPNFYETNPEKGFEKIINANSYPGILERDRRFWEITRRLYEFISNFKRIPLIGDTVFSTFDAFQRILSFYPKRDLSRPNFSLRQIHSLIKKGWGRDLIEKLKKKPLPLITTFFTPAFMAEFFNYPAEIFCIVCDADIARSWAPLIPQISKIKYFAPNERVKERLMLYGIKPGNIFLSGYPLPLENIGSENLEILKEDLKYRILNLDPQKRYFEKYKVLIENKLGRLPEKSDHPLTIMFSVGGAGAQKEIGAKMLKGLINKIRNQEIKIILSVGIRKEIKRYFEAKIRGLGLERYSGENVDPVRNIISNGVEILFGKDIEDYFQKFNLALRKTDILWTKPSELSFYAALGLPVIIAPTIGSQEEFNERWLLKSGFGILQENPSYIKEWLFDWLDQGYLAECAMQGFIEGEKLGTLQIFKKICRG